MCDKCFDTGRIQVSLASAENGPTDDPADEIGYEYCDCPHGYELFRDETGEYESQHAKYFKLIAR